MGTETAIKDELLETAICRLAMHDGEFAAKVDARVKECLAVADASRRLANFVFRSVNVGPLTKDPSKEAYLWTLLRKDLEQFYAEALPT